MFKRERPWSVSLCRASPRFVFPVPRSIAWERGGEGEGGRIQIQAASHGGCLSIRARQDTMSQEPNGSISAQGQSVDVLLVNTGVVFRGLAALCDPNAAMMRKRPFVQVSCGLTGQAPSGAAPQGRKTDERRSERQLTPVSLPNVGGSSSRHDISSVHAIGPCARVSGAV